MTTSGNIQRLRLLLDAQPEEYYGPYSYDATGFKILVHDQNESYPNIEDFGVDLPPGFTTNIRVRRTKVGLKKLSSSLFETSFSRHLVPVVQKVDCVPGGGAWVNVCWVFANGLSEPLPNYSLFFGQL